MLPCQQKQRFQTRPFAEAVAKRQIGISGVLSPYFCQAHGCWHLGHSRPRGKRLHRFDWGPQAARSLVAQHRATLVAEFQQSKDLEIWRGVRVLSRVLIHLSR